MTKKELIETLGLDPQEDKVYNWDELSYVQKAMVVRILKENGYTNAGEVLQTSIFAEQARFAPIGYIVFCNDSKEDLQSYFD